MELQHDIQRHYTSTGPWQRRRGQAMPINKWQYNNGGAEFILERVDANTVKVTHLEQIGWFGLNADWDADQPYAWTTSERDIKANGIDGIFRHTTPDDTLKMLCNSLLRDQRKADSKRINPEQRQEAARKVLDEFLRELSA